jgi:predicted DNA-binding protein with PD1-like motif
MRTKVLNESPERTIAAILDRGDEVMSSLQRCAVEFGLVASRITAIGAFERATVGYFDWQTKTYEPIAVDEQVEVLSLVGDITLDGSQPKVHAHVVLGRRDGSTVGGHLLEAHVRPTLEVMIVDAPSYLRREFDPASGITLVRV